MPRLQIDHSLFAGSKELPGNEASSSVSENTKRDVTQPPIGPGSGSSYNTGQPYSRRTSKGKGEKSGKLDKKKQGGHQGKHQGKSGKHDKKGDKGKSA
ncbi:hypothetical protein BGZ83_004690 [Gryganskiella cystojenkinii]|nr:hypothetical protein BGZ83_004690 [Gryganskiella cystojenkinii]